GTPGDIDRVRFPSGLSPSVQEFHLVSLGPWALGSRTVTAGSEFHRPQCTRASSARREPTVAGSAGRMTADERRRPSIRRTTRRPPADLLPLAPRSTSIRLHPPADLLPLVPRSTSISHTYPGVRARSPSVGPSSSCARRRRGR